MTASDIFNYTVPFIEALAPVILITAIIVNAGALMEFIYGIFDRG